MPTWDDKDTKIGRALREFRQVYRKAGSGAATVQLSLTDRAPEQEAVARGPLVVGRLC
jgi:hypothetical protein